MKLFVNEGGPWNPETFAFPLHEKQAGITDVLRHGQKDASKHTQ